MSTPPALTYNAGGYTPQYASPQVSQGQSPQAALSRSSSQGSSNSISSVEKAAFPVVPLQATLKEIPEGQSLKYQSLPNSREDATTPSPARFERRRNSDSLDDPVERTVKQHRVVNARMPLPAKWRRDTGNCWLIALKTTAAVGAMIAYNFSLIAPRLRALTWGGILLGNAVAFPPKKTDPAKVCKVAAAVLLGGGIAFLPEYFLQDKNPVAGQILTSLIYFVSINYIWRKALEDLHSSYKGPQRAALGSAGALITYKLSHSFLQEPWATFLGTVGVIGGNMYAFPAPPTACNQFQKYVFCLMPSLIATALNGYAVDDKTKQGVVTAFGETFSLAMAWYYGNKGLEQQRLNACAFDGELLEEDVATHA